MRIHDRAVRGAGMAAGSALLAVLLASAALAASDEAKDSAARGGVTYRMYCSNCHGRGGKGDGKLATELRRRPADLTRLAADNGGTFDAAAVRQAIDGRGDVASHGESDMPVWGISFRDPAKGDEQEPQVERRIRDLVAYLATLQVEDDD